MTTLDEVKLFFQSRADGSCTAWSLPDNKTAFKILESDEQLAVSCRLRCENFKNLRDRLTTDPKSANQPELYASIAKLLSYV